MVEDISAVGMSGGAIFAGGPREIMVTGDHLTWYSWSCPLGKIAGLYVDDGLLAVIGDGQLAVSEVRHKGRLWHVVELVDEPTCIHASIGSRVFVGTREGRLFEFKVRRERGLLEWLGIRKRAPVIEEVAEMVYSSSFETDHIEWGMDNE